MFEFILKNTNIFLRKLYFLKHAQLIQKHRSNTHSLDHFVSHAHKSVHSII